jgi:hypothetical protein
MFFINHCVVRDLLTIFKHKSQVRFYRRYFGYANNFLFTTLKSQEISQFNISINILQYLNHKEFVLIYFNHFLVV